MPTPALVVAFWAVLIGYPLIRILAVIAAKPLFNRVAALARELAAAYPDETSKIKGTVSLAFRNKIVVGFAVVFPLLVIALVFPRLQKSLAPLPQTEERHHTPLDEDPRFERLNVLAVMSSASTAPVAALWLSFELFVALALILPIAWVAGRVSDPWPSITTIARDWANRIAHHGV